MKNCSLSLRFAMPFRRFLIRSLLSLFGFMAIGFFGCSSSSSQDDASMQATEPVEAIPVEEKSASGESPSTADAAAPAPAPAGTAPAGTAPANEAASVPAIPPPTSAPAVAESGTSSGTMMNTSRRVLYVKVDSAVLREKPESKANVVGKASRGDHFLVTIEGDWAKTEDGKFIAMKVLSERGVGRGKKSADWGQAEPAIEKPKKKKAKKQPVPANTEKSSVSPAVKSEKPTAPSKESLTPGVGAENASTPAEGAGNSANPSGEEK